jgi:hypothetical protein
MLRDGQAAHTATASEANAMIALAGSTSPNLAPGNARHASTAASTYSNPHITM